LGLKRRVVQYYEKGERDGKEIDIPKYVRLACFAVVKGAIDYKGPDESQDDKDKRKRKSKANNHDKDRKAKGKEITSAVTSKKSKRKGPDQSSKVQKSKGQKKPDTATKAAESPSRVRTKPVAGAGRKDKPRSGKDKQKVHT
jgi:hypothetical protein